MRKSSEDRLLAKELFQENISSLDQKLYKISYTEEIPNNLFEDILNRVNIIGLKNKISKKKILKVRKIYYEMMSDELKYLGIRCSRLMEDFYDSIAAILTGVAYIIKINYTSKSPTRFEFPFS